MWLRRLYALDGWIMLVVGFAFWGYHQPLASGFGIDTSGPFMAKFELWKAISFGGLFGGALMAFGFAALAISRSRDAAFLRSTCGYFLAGHGFLTFMAFAKQVALWETTCGAFILQVAAVPATGFLYFLVAGGGGRTVTTRERQLREVAGQEERSRLAQDLHDSVKQQIYSMQTNLAAAQARWDDDRGGSREALDRARDSARDAMTEMIALLDRLKRNPLESVGLVEALRRQAEALGLQTGASVSTSFGALPPPDRFEPAMAMSVFRIAQEAMANVARHARPAHVHVTAGLQGDGRFVFSVRDDGAGFDLDARTAAGMGLTSIHTRALELGASLTIESSPGQGCELSVSVPVVDPAAQRRQRYIRRMLAAGMPLAIVALTTLAYPDSTGYVWPLLVAGAAFEVTQAVALVRQR